MNNGGPAFPCAWENDGDMNATAPNGHVVPPGCTELMHGMTMRDYFAAKALMGLLAEPFSDDAPPTSEYVGGEKLQDDLPGDVIARAAYRLADAMLRAREK
jgi:hypothetical protein